MPNAQGLRRPWHILQPVTGLSIPERCIFVAVRTRVEREEGGIKEHVFADGFAAACYLRDGSLVDKLQTAFKKAATFWEFVDTHRLKRGCTWVFAYQVGSLLSLLGFWDQLERSGDSLLSAVIEDPPTIITTRRGGRLIKYVDTLNYWRANLRDICGARTNDGSTIAPPGRDGEPWGQEPSSVVSIAERLVIGVMARCAAERICSWQPTAASLAWHCYRRNFLSTKIWCHGHQEAIELERKCSLAGRLELWHHGRVNQPVAALDANSLYPSVMKDNLYPCKLVEFFDGCNTEALVSALSSSLCVALVDIWRDDAALLHPNPGEPALPNACRREALCGRELADMQLSGRIYQCYQLARYEPGDLFAGFVDYLYPRKVAAQMHGHPSDVLLYKLLLNSLWGKFTQQRKRWVDDAREIPREHYGSWWVMGAQDGRPTRYRSIAGRVQRLSTGGEGRDTFPAVGACVAANARVRMESYLAVAGRGNYLYADTDCLHVVRAGEQYLYRAGVVSTYELGLLKEQCRGPDAEYWGPKHYRVGDKFVCSALSSGAVQRSDGLWVETVHERLPRRIEQGHPSTVLAVPRTVRLAGAGHTFGN